MALKEINLLLSGPEIYLGPDDKSTVAENPFNPEYLQRLKDRDQKALDHFVSYFKPRLERKFRARRVQEADVQELISDTFFRVLNAIDHDEIRLPHAFAGYVNGVADRVYLDFVKSQRHDVVIDGDFDCPSSAPGPDILFLRKERGELVKKILQKLSWRDRNLLRLKLFAGLSNDEIAEQLGVPPDRLRVVLHRARKRFEKLCKKQGLDFKH